jgi:hypothetical protein
MENFWSDFSAKLLGQCRDGLRVLDCQVPGPLLSCTSKHRLHWAKTKWWVHNWSGKALLICAVLKTHTGWLQAIQPFLLPTQCTARKDLLNHMQYQGSGRSLVVCKVCMRMQPYTGDQLPSLLSCMQPAGDACCALPLWRERVMPVYPHATYQEKTVQQVHDHNGPHSGSTPYSRVKLPCQCQ